MIFFFFFVSCKIKTAFTYIYIYRERERERARSWMEESPGTAADGGIGPIVWVRRRNGSWWPGHIMEADELAEYNLTSPRTGTPVKLLGRDDASV